jgi:DNA (cytosine-5)-methyltransferase 1
MELSKLTKAELLIKCDELGLIKVKSKTKTELITLINEKALEKQGSSLTVEDDISDMASDSDYNSDCDENLIMVDEENKIIDNISTTTKVDLSNYKFIDLFCGIGGFHQALHKLGAKCVLACDIDKACRVVYKENYGIEPVSNVKDINEKTMVDFDIICAGFPCFVAGTKTLTNNGYKNIEDVTLSDKLLTHTGKFQNIVNLQRKTYTGLLYDFKIKYHPELITATEEHPFYVREQKKTWNTSLKKYDYSYGEPVWKNASKLTMNDYFGMVINTKEEMPEFDEYTYTQADGIKEWVVTSLELAYGLQRLYLSLGVIISVEKVFCDVKKCNAYKLHICGEPQDDTSSFIEGNYVWYAPVEITSSETTQIPVYNFEVETDNSYVVENICVHNCQAFSNGGNKKCFEDERGLLFDEIIRIAKEKKPKFMFLENVKHILKVSNGEVIDYIKKKIANIGYRLQIFNMSPHNYGIPQQRERVYFVCVRNDIYNGTDIVLPTYIGGIDFNKFLDKKEEIDEKYFIKDDILNTLEAWDEIIKQFETGEKISPTIMMNDAFKSYSQIEFSGFPNWKQDYITKNKPLIEKYYNQFKPWYNKHSAILQKREIYGKLEWQTGPIKNNDSIFNHFIQIRQSGIRVKKGHYFPTLVAISNIPIYGKEKRYITPRECARLQSFPDSFKLSKDDKKSYKQLGNSVNVDNVYTVISSTFKHYL